MLTTFTVLIFYYIHSYFSLYSLPSSYAVRASAVSALAKFAARCEELRPSIIPLLTRCLDDDDDEVCTAGIEFVYRYVHTRVMRRHPLTPARRVPHCLLRFVL